MRTRMIDLIPIGGLGNRMRAMDAAIALHQTKGDRLRVFWEAEEHLNCTFDKLFRPIPDIEVVDGLPFHSRLIRRFGRFHGLTSKLGCLNGISYYHHDENDRLEGDVASEKILRLKKLHIISFARFYPTEKNYRLFKPIPELEERIGQITRLFDPWTIGVHIRRTDNVNAIEVSPTWMFVEAMEQAIIREPRTRFYLATDCMTTKKELVQRFGNRIMTGIAPVLRSSQEGMQHALIELFALSRTSFMFRSHYSSFSRTAAEIGGIGSRVIERTSISSAP